MKNKKAKRICSFLLCMLMVLSLCPVSAFAEEASQAKAPATELLAEEPAAPAAQDAQETAPAVTGTGDQDSSALAEDTALREENASGEETADEKETAAEEDAAVKEDAADTEDSEEETVEEEKTKAKDDKEEDSEEERAKAAAFQAAAPETPDFYKIVFIDCGRKYFSVSSLETLIDNAAAAGMNTVQLAVGNDGLRFLLDDMSLTVGDVEFSSETVSAGIHKGNEAYSDFETDELTQSQMDEIIYYAYTKGITIIPCINSPGHMDAILDCMEYCGLGTVSYDGSARTVDVTNSTAVAFTEILIGTYVQYFASRGCKIFNMGADEYANDVYTSGGMGFGNLISSGKYSSFISYVNALSGIIEHYEMTPMAFNDGIYYDNNTSFGTFDQNIIICYWSNGWDGYRVASASYLREMGFSMINANSDYYWVLGKSSWQCSAEKAAQFDINAFMGSTIDDPLGAQFCIWCDYPQADSDSNVIATTAPVIAAFGSAMPKDREMTGTTTGNPFPQGTADSNSFRIPSLVTLSDGTLVAAADARWNTTYDGGGLDTITSYSTDGGANWNWRLTNYLSDNGDKYNGSDSTAFIDPSMAVTADDTIYLLCDLYPYGVALNGSGNTAPSTSLGFDANGNLLLSNDDGENYDYYLNLSDLCIYSSKGDVQSDYSVDAHFNVTYGKKKSNLFYKDSPFTVVRTGYLYLVRSTDGGKTWSDPQLITNAKTSSEMACLVAPGGSMVTKSGRIIFPVYSYNGNSESQRVSFLYSDDGVNWTRSTSLNYQWGSESECVELDDGTLRFFFRNGTGFVCYADVRETNGSYKWSTPVQTELSVNSNTQISALRTSFTVDDCTAILLSCPTDSSSRKNGKIFVGLVQADGTMTWPYSMDVPSDNGSDVFQYSCLTEMSDGNIALLYENYSIGWGSGSDCYCTMDFDTYTMEQIAPGAVIGASAAIERAEINFDEGWKFHLGDASSASEKAYDDSSWTSVSLPHDFSITQSFTTNGEAESGYLPGGTGWYRKTFPMDKTYKGKKMLLSFDGVYSDAYVYVNGTYVGENHYGYSSFAFDISKYLVCDGKTENTIAVKAVNNVPSSRWYSGSGIYRDVTLVVTNAVHADSNGVSVTTPDIASGRGTAQTVTEIVNSSSKDVTVQVKTEILARGSAEVAAVDETEVEAPAGETVTATCSPIVSSPALWSTSDPNLYTARVTLTVNEEVVDTVSVDFGYRWYSFTDTGFQLNGKAVKLNGVCLHNDEGGLGSAAYTDAITRQLTIMKDMGANAIRCTHNPASRDLIEQCDRLGLLVIEELFDGWSVAKNGNTNDFSKYFTTQIASDNAIYGAHEDETWAEYAARSIVRRDRNSASVILWSLGNEIQEGASADSSFPTIAQNLINWIKAEDSTRPTTIGDNTRSTDTSSVLGKVLQVIRNNGGVVGFNYASSAQLEELSGIWGPIYSSETSSAVNSRSIYTTQETRANADGKYHLTSYDTSAVSWGMTAHESLWNTYTEDYIAGEFVWTGFDYIGEPTPYNGTGSGSVTGSGAVPNSSYFGIVDTCGFEKDTYYFYRSQWNKNANTLHLVTAWDSNNMLTTSGKTPVVIYSNAPKVELYRDGVLIGTATRTANKTDAGFAYYTYSVKSNDSSVCSAVSASGSESLYATFHVAYQAGTLSAKAYDADGKEITSSCDGRTSVTTPGSAAKVSVSLDNADIYNGGLAYIAVDVLDANGNPVTTAANQLSFEITEGSGRILAVDNGDQATTKKYQQASVLTDSQHAQIEAYAGKALVIVSGGSGTKISVTADGLQGAVYTIGGSSEPIVIPVGLIDADGSVVDERNLSLQMGGTATVSFSGKSTGSELTAVSSDPTVAEASVSDSGIKVKALLDGSADITVKEKLSDGTEGTYMIHVTVEKVYSSVQEIALAEGETSSWTDATGNYSSSVNKNMLNPAVATVEVSGFSKAGTPATAASTTKCSSFAAGNVIIGYESGSTKVYLRRSGSSLSTTTDPEQATVWALSGSSSAATLKSDSYYLCHSTSAVSVSTSTSNASWTFSNGNLSFSSSSSSRWWFSRSSTYYLRYNNGFTVSTSTSNKAAVYTVTPGTEEIPAENTTTVNVTALAGGKTGFVMNDTLYRITVKSSCEHAWGEGVVTKQATCTAEGVMTYTCSKCGTTKTETIEKNTSSHTWDKSVVTVKATCQSEGVKTYTCTECGATKTDTIEKDASNHTGSTETKGAVAATCMKAGYSGDTYCTGCGAKLSAGKEIPATGDHTWDSGKVTKKATCASAGEKTYTCTVCETTKTEETEKDASNHTGDTVVKNQKDATCGAAGYTGDTCCKGCGAKLSAGKEIPATGDHTWDSGKITTEPTYTTEGVRTYTCSVCKATKTEAVAKLTSGYTLAGSITSGSEYVIVNSGYALKNSGSSLSSQEVSISDGGFTEIDDSCIWILTKSGSGYTLRNKSTGKYLTVTSSRFWFWTTYSLGTSSSATTWTVNMSDSQATFYTSSRYLAYSSGFTLASSSSSAGMSLYQKK